MPFLVVAGGSVLVMLTIAVHRNHKAACGLTLATLLLGLASVSLTARHSPRPATFLLVLDGYTCFYLVLLLGAGIAVALMSYAYLERRDGEREEFYVMLLLATLGACVLAASAHFASFLLGLEILSVSLYVLIGYTHTRERSLEAAVKYLVLAAIAAAFLFFGMALLYAGLGTMELARMSALLISRTGDPEALLVAGFALVIVGIGFKLAVVPFHMWTPDIYEGAPAPATAFVASASKGGMVALMVRYLTQLQAVRHGALFLLFALIAIASMLAGNLLALRQNNIKRLLAYSSIANWGYLLVAFLAGGPGMVAAAAYFLVAYFAAILIAFGIVSVLSGPDREADDLADYRGLYLRRPWLAAIFTVALLSLAGIPLTAGFVAKFYVLSIGVDAALWTLVLILVGSSGIGLYYYLRVVVAMSQSPATGETGAQPPGTLISSAVLAALTAVLIWLGTYPAPILRWLQSANL